MFHLQSLVQVVFLAMIISRSLEYSMTYSTVQYSTVQYSTVHYSTVQYSTVQYSTVLDDLPEVVLHVPDSLLQLGIAQLRPARGATAPDVVLAWVQQF